MNISSNPFTALSLNKANQPFKANDNRDIREPLSYCNGNGDEMVKIGTNEDGRARYVSRDSDEYRKEREEDIAQTERCGGND